jgi:ribonuclease Z
VHITFLGTSAGTPTRQRNVSGLVLVRDGRHWLFDCGEGTQHRFLELPVSRGRLDRIFITHLHGDHVFGLPGLLAGLSLLKRRRPLDLHGPPGLGRLVRGVLEATSSHLTYELRVHETAEGVVFEDDELVVTAARLQHRVAAWGYRVQEKDRPGRFDAAAARALGVPPGPLLGRLAAGETLEIEGRTVDGAALVGPPRPGRAFVYCTDTTPCEAAVRLAHGADLLVHEATFADSEQALADSQEHSTGRGAATVARRAGVRCLVLFHVSARYDADGLARLVAEASEEFAHLAFASDGDTFVVGEGTPA